MKKALLVLLLLTAGSPVWAQGGELTPGAIDQLLKEARENGRGFDRLRDYTYVRRAGRTRTLPNGQIKDESTTYEIFYLLPDYQRRRLGYSHIKTHENGIPLPADVIEKERKSIIEDAVETYAKLAKTDQAIPQLSKYPGVYFGVSVNKNVKGLSPEPLISFDIPSLLGSCDFTNPRNEKLNGRDTVVLDWTAKNANEIDDEHEFLARASGTIWIDALDRIVVKALAFPRDPAQRQATPAASFEAMRLPEGFWVTQESRLNGELYPRLFNNKVNENYYHQTSDYKRFYAEIKDSKIAKPPGK